MTENPKKASTETIELTLVCVVISASPLRVTQPVHARVPGVFGI
jgi:hypothetical protein